MIKNILFCQSYEHCVLNFAITSTTLAKEKTKALDSLVKLLGYDKLESGATSSTKALTEALAQLDLEKEGRA